MSFFGRQSRFVSMNETLPGVGNYSTQKWRCSSKVKGTQSVSIGKSKRLSLEDNKKIPGPGSYNLSKTVKSPHPFLIGRPKQKLDNQAPGPGSYSVDASVLLTNNPKFSMTGNHFHLKEDKKPGPCDYFPDLKAISKTDPSIGFSIVKRQNKIQQAKYPGPGQYNTKTNQNSNKFSFTSTKKFQMDQAIEKQKMCLPGPGQYKSNIQKKIRGGKFTAGKKQRTFTSSCLPGPGDYNIQGYKKHSSGIVINKSPRLKDQKQVIPGPIYEIPPVELYKSSMRKTATSFSRSKKGVKYETPIPGPGSYNPQLASHQKDGITLKGYINKQKPQIRPGPLDYNPNYDSISAKSPIVRIAPQTKLKHSSNNKSPGPTSYTVNDDYRVKSFYFPKSNEHNNKQSIPGPGHYRTKSFFGKLPSYLNVANKTQDL